MPPPQRRPRTASTPHRDMVSVYPPRSVSATLGGYRSVPFTQAVRCWAKLLEPATEDMARRLSAAEWNYIALAGKDKERSVDPDWANPGELLAQWVEAAVRYEIELASVGGKERADKVAQKLRGLDYLHAWAVIWALQCRADALEHVRPGDSWWTLAYRQGRFA